MIKFAPISFLQLFPLNYFNISLSNELSLGLEGVSTHSFRRTALTNMSNAGIGLRIIQEISGHRDLSQLQNYLEVAEAQVLGAIASLSMLSPVEHEVGKYVLDDLPKNEKSQQIIKPKRLRQLKKQR